MGTAFSKRSHAISLHFSTVASSSYNYKIVLKRTTYIIRVIIMIIIIVVDISYSSVVYLCLVESVLLFIISSSI